MWIASGLVSETGIAERAVHSGVTRLAQSSIAAGGASLEVVLPDGSRIGFGLPARCAVTFDDVKTSQPSSSSSRKTAALNERCCIRRIIFSPFAPAKTEGNSGALFSPPGNNGSERESSAFNCRSGNPNPSGSNRLFSPV